MNTANQPESGSKLFLNILSIPVRGETTTVENISIKGIDPEPWNPFIIQVDDIISLDLIDIDIWDDLLDHLSSKGLSRFGIQFGNEVGCTVHSIQRHP